LRDNRCRLHYFGMDLIKKYHFFVSDVHLGLNVCEPVEREKRFVAFLDSLPPETASLWLMGDIFDFWFEYKYVVPKGYTRVFGSLARLSDSGVNIYFFRGNHDMWSFGYFEKELGFCTIEQPHIVRIGDRNFCLGHGDAVGEGDRSYKVLKWIFNNRFFQWCLKQVHPRWTFSFARRWSKHNRLSKNERYDFREVGKSVIDFAEKFGRENNIDYFIFGHYHAPAQIELSYGGKLEMLGEWINDNDFLLFDINTNRIERGHYTFGGNLPNIER